MSFKARFYLIFFVVMTLTVIIVDQILGKLYVRYMILFTATFFILGLEYGQRSERKWLKKFKERSKAG